MEDAGSHTEVVYVKVRVLADRGWPGRLGSGHRHKGSEGSGLPCKARLRLSAEPACLT